MIKPIAYERAPILVSPLNQEVHRSVSKIVDGEIAGIVFKKSRVRLVADTARSLGFNSTRNYTGNAEFDRLPTEAIAQVRRGLPLESSWFFYGVTPLHADGEEGVPVLSVSNVVKGAVEIQVFQRGPQLLEMHSSDLMDHLKPDTARVLTSQKVDTEILLPQATRLRASADDIFVFSANHVHLGITLDAPRKSVASFFYR